MTLEDRIKLTKSTLKDVDKMRKTKGNKEGIQVPVVPTDTGKTEICIQSEGHRSNLLMRGVKLRLVPPYNQT